LYEKQVNRRRVHAMSRTKHIPNVNMDPATASVCSEGHV